MGLFLNANIDLKDNDANEGNKLKNEMWNCTVKFKKQKNRKNKYTKSGSA